MSSGWGMLLVGGVIAGLLLGLVGCGGGSPAAPELNSGAPAAPSGPVFVPLPATATPWPTFTPVATAVSVPVERAVAADAGPVEFGEAVEEPVEVEFLATFTPAPAPTSTPLPRATLAPTVAAVVPVGIQGSAYDSETVATVAAPAGGPGPTPYGKVPGAEVYFDRQSFFVLQLAELPPQLLEDDFALLPGAMDVVPASAPFLVWFVVYDLSRVGKDFEAELTVRWIDLKFPERPLVMFRSPVRLAWHQPLFWNGLGEFGGGFWRPGHYRVELIDRVGRILIDWEFRVI